MKYTIEKVSYSPKLFHNKDAKRRVKAYKKDNGLFVARVPMSKNLYRIYHVNGSALPKYYKTRKEALNDILLLQTQNWTDFERNMFNLRALYREITKL